MRKLNFNAGPAVLPLAVLEKAQAEFLNFQGTGMSVLEISHRSGEFINVLENTRKSLSEVLGIPDGYDILFLGGGASLQFAMIPMNFLQSSADYVDTGSWSDKAIKEAKNYGNVNVVASSKAENYDHIPKNVSFSRDAQYVHITSNNTIFGTQWQSFPDTGNIPLFVDMSSDILSRKIDVSKFSLIYAGAQKNAGPAGVTIVIMKKELTAQSNSKAPTMLQYKTHADNDSCYNTPPVFQIYLVGLIVDWIKEQGGITQMENLNKEKGKLLYGTMDRFPEYYKGTVAKESRSLMNVTFRLPSEELEKKFIKEATAQNFEGLKGHRSVGGIRVSMYNAMTVAGVQTLTQFMENFAKNNQGK